MFDRSGSKAIISLNCSNSPGGHNREDRPSMRSLQYVPEVVDGLSDSCTVFEGLED